MQATLPVPDMILQKIYYIIHHLIYRILSVLIYAICCHIPPFSYYYIEIIPIICCHYMHISIFTFSAAIHYCCFRHATELCYFATAFHIIIDMALLLPCDTRLFCRRLA